MTRATHLLATLGLLLLASTLAFARNTAPTGVWSNQGSGFKTVQLVLHPAGHSLLVSPVSSMLIRWKTGVNGSLSGRPMKTGQGRCSWNGEATT